MHQHGSSDQKKTDNHARSMTPGLRELTPRAMHPSPVRRGSSILVMMGMTGRRYLSAMKKSPVVIAATPSTSAPTTGTNRPAATSEAAAETPAPQVSSPDASEHVAFGLTKTYGDGLQVTVSKGTNFTPSQYAVGADGRKAFVKHTITIVNGTGKVFDHSSFTASVQRADAEGSQIYDTDLEGTPTTKLLKGRQSKFVVGFGVADAKDVVLEVQPGFEYES